MQYDGYLQREETNAAILALSKSGLPIKRIASQTGYARQTIRASSEASAPMYSECGKVR
jgi:predicted transcriptional regulator